MTINRPSVDNITQQVTGNKKPSANTTTTTTIERSSENDFITNTIAVLSVIPLIILLAGIATYVTIIVRKAKKHSKLPDNTAIEQNIINKNKHS